MHKHFLVFLLILSIGTTQIQAEFYAIIVGDTTNATLGRACESDVAAMKNVLKSIAKYTKQPIHLTILSGFSVTAENAKQIINELPIITQDIVVLYFSQHGYRISSSSTPWPILYFGLSNSGINFNEINQSVLDKKPRFLFSFADTCNNELPEDQAPPVVLLKGETKTEDNNIVKRKQRSYTKLFLKTRGYIILSGAIPGTVSYSYVTKGSICTLSFIESLSDQVVSKSCSWPTVLHSTFSKTQSKAKSSGIEQTPQFISEIR